MTSIKKPTKKQILKMIDDLEKNPNDKVRILGDIGVTVVGVGLGVAAAGTIASVTGVTAITGVTAVASWFGFTLVAVTPVGWVIGAAVAGGALTYGISRAVRSGGISEGKKKQMLIILKEKAKDAEAKERAKDITPGDKNNFIIYLREFIERDLVTSDEAHQLITNVEEGRIPISEAYRALEKFLNGQ